MSGERDAEHGNSRRVELRGVLVLHAAGELLDGRAAIAAYGEREQPVVEVLGALTDHHSDVGMMIECA